MECAGGGAECDQEEPDGQEQMERTLHSDDNEPSPRTALHGTAEEGVEKIAFWSRSTRCNPAPLWSLRPRRFLSTALTYTSYDSNDGLVCWQK